MPLSYGIASLTHLELACIEPRFPVTVPSTSYSFIRFYVAFYCCRNRNKARFCIVFRYNVHSKLLNFMTPISYPTGNNQSRYVTNHPKLEFDDFSCNSEYQCQFHHCLAIHTST